MRGEILKAAEVWHDDWLIHKSYDQMTNFLATVKPYLDRGELSSDTAMSLTFAALEWANDGSRERFDELLHTIPE